VLLMRLGEEARVRAAIHQMQHDQEADCDRSCHAINDHQALSAVFAMLQIAVGNLEEEMALLQASKVVALLACMVVGLMGQQKR
jgi:hypothetical protein